MFVFIYIDECTICALDGFTNVRENKWTVSFSLKDYERKSINGSLSGKTGIPIIQWSYYDSRSIPCTRFDNIILMIPSYILRLYLLYM